jgi:DNA-binding XRE family transcriptional regulator
MKDYSFLAAQIRAARAILGWSQSYLAEGVNVNKSTIVDLEANRRVPHEVTVDNNTQTEPEGPIKAGPSELESRLQLVWHPRHDRQPRQSFAGRKSRHHR